MCDALCCRVRGQVSAILSRLGGGSTPHHPETLPLAHYATMLAECGELYPEVAKLRGEATTCQAALDREHTRGGAPPLVLCCITCGAAWAHAAPQVGDA